MMVGVPTSPPHARPLVGTAVGLASVAAILATLGPLHGHLGEGTPGLLMVVPVVVAGLIGGVRPALVVAVAATLAFSVGFLPPVGTLRVDVPADVLALAVFTVVAGAVGTLVARAETRRVAAEQRAVEIERMHAELAAAELERSRLLVDAERARALEQLDGQRAALLRSVSHDLRTPLVTIRAVASDLHAGTDYDEVTRTRLLLLVAQEADRLDRLVANLLDMSRIEAGALAPALDAVALDELVDATVARFRAGLGDADVDVVVDVAADLPEVLADHTQLGQVVINLLENAARHSPRGGSVEIAARVDGGAVVVTVRDHGRGLAGAVPSRLFEPFVSTGPGRTGLGLAICRAIVEAHAGTIEARDESEGGATFSFTIPIAP